MLIYSKWRPKSRFLEFFQHNLEIYCVICQHTIEKFHNRKICSKMITSIIRYHTAIHYIMSITRDRFRPSWVSSGGCKKHSIINMLKKQICHWVQKNATQNNMIQQYLYQGGHIQGHTHMTWTTSHIGKP